MVDWAKDHECIAANIVAAREGGEALERDLPSADNNTHDFDIITADGTIALEVTQAVTPAELKMYGATPPVIEGLKSGWAVMVDPDKVKVKKLGWLEPILRDLEETGASKHMPIRGQDPFDLKIRGVHGLYESGGLPGQLTVGLASNTGSGSFDDLNELAESFSRLADNRSKLAKTDAIERHLFILASATRPETIWALHPEASTLPVDGPTLPGEVDRVWVCGAFGRWPLVTCRRGGSWEGPEMASDVVQPVI